MKNEKWKMKKRKVKIKNTQNSVAKVKLALNPLSRCLNFILISPDLKVGANYKLKQRMIRNS